MDVYRDSFFLQQGSLDGTKRSATRTFDDGSVLFALSCDNDFLDGFRAYAAEPENPGGLDACLTPLLNKSGEELEALSLLLFYIDPAQGFLECISQHMPPIMLKKKSDEVIEIEQNFVLKSAAASPRAITRMPLEEVGIMLLVNDVRVMTELKNRSLMSFAKCELEKAIKSFSNRDVELECSYMLFNNTLKDRIKFSHHEVVPAKLASIIRFESDLERMLKDSYPGSWEVNDNALTVFNELLLNAYEHGTLGIDSDKKQELMVSGEYEEYLEEREKETDKTIDVEVVIYEQNLLKITVKDQGNGFDFTQFDCREKDIALNLLHGRGVQMANQISSTAYFEDGGSKVTFFMKYEVKEAETGFHHSEDAMLAEMSLLYVEDDLFIREQFSKIIQRMVGRLHVAEDGAEGLELYRMERPDIVLTDIEMPKMNGLDMAEKIKELNHDQSILIMTAYNQDDKFMRAIDIGVDKYVIKPVKITQLRQSLHNVAKQIFFKKEAMRLLKEKEARNMAMLSSLQSENRYAIAQQEAASRKQELIIHDDSAKYPKGSCKIFYKPLERLSGDIYGVYRVDPNHTFLYIVDSMGKGLAASVTAVLSAAYINRAIDMSISGGGFFFQRLLDDYRDYIRKYLLDDECLSFAMIHIDHRAGTFAYSSFGMYPILVKDCETLEISAYPSNNAPFTKYLPTSVSSEAIPLPEKYGLFVFSDGLVETELFGMQELVYHLKEGEEDEEIDLFKKVMDSSFIADDDLTLIHFSSGCDL